MYPFWPFCKVVLPAKEAARVDNVILYTRKGCHLCDDAHELLLRYGLQPQLIDIDDSPALREKYDTCVPVVVIDGRERFRGRINTVLLERLLHNRTASVSDPGVGCGGAEAE